MTSTYAKRPKQADRLSQVAHKRQSMATAPVVADVVVRDCRKGTTLAPLGETIPEIRRSRAAHATGSEGKSSAKHAPSKTSAGVASGSVCIGTSSMSGVGHTAAQSPGEASSSLPNMVNINRSRLNAFDGYRLRDFNPAAFAGLFLITLSAVTVIFGAAVFFGWLASVVFQ